MTSGSDKLGHYRDGVTSYETIGGAQVRWTTSRISIDGTSTVAVPSLMATGTSCPATSSRAEAPVTPSGTRTRTRCGPIAIVSRIAPRIAIGLLRFTIAMATSFPDSRNETSSRPCPSIRTCGSSRSAQCTRLASTWP